MLERSSAGGLPVDELLGEFPVERPPGHLPLDELLGEVTVERADDPPANGVAQPVTEPGSARVRQVVAGPLLGLDRSRRRVPFLIAALILVVELIIAIYRLAIHRDDTASRAAPSRLVQSARPAAPPAALTAALAWVHRSLSPGSTIAADASTAATLRRGGFPLAIDVGSAAGRLSTVDYLIDVASDSTSAEQRVRARSLPLALFGSAADQVSVREVFPGGVTSARTRDAADARLRVEAGRELLTNPRLAPDAATRAELAVGALDFRVETVLSDLAGTDQVAVGDLVLDPAERRADRPVRSVSVTTTDLRATQAVLARIRAPYRPDTVVMVSARKLRLTWMPAIAPAPSAGG